MKTALFIYLLIGLLLNLLGPVAESLREKLEDRRDEPTPSWKNIFYEVFVRALVIVFYPLLYWALGYTYFEEKRQSRDIDPKYREDNYRHVRNLSVGKNGHCNDCGFNQKIISLLHSSRHGSCGCFKEDRSDGFEEGRWSIISYQCQQCGKFNEIERDMTNARGQICECGGKLELEMPVFCPKCRSKDVFVSVVISKPNSLGV